MGTFTAQILVGRSHIYHGGIIPSHILFLSENGRSAWCLYPFDSYNCHRRDSNIFRVWICDPSTILRDVMVMIALFVMKNENLINLVEAIHKDLQYEEYFEFASLKNRELFYDESLSLDWSGLKLVVSIFNESSAFNIKYLLNYRNLEFEVCVSFYERRYNVFLKELQVEDKSEELDSLFQYLEHLKGYG